MRKFLSSRKNIIIVIAVLLAGVITGTTAFGILYFKPTPEPHGQNIGANENNDNEPAAKLDKRVSFLLIGADKRPADKSFNADSLIVASVDPESKIISMLSIPRDTRVVVGSSQFVKINAVPMLRSIPELMKQVTELTGIALDGYVMTNFEGFKSIIDTLGGITVYVEKEMGPYETGDKVDGYIHVLPGEQRMSGSLALQYARFRNDALADISRTARQQNVLKSVAKEMLQVSTITKIPKLIPQLMEAVETNLSLADILKLSKVAAGFNSSNIVSQTLPGVFLDLDGLSYWEVNRTQAKTVATNLLLGITTDKIVNQTVLDLLSPDIKAHVTVPGGPKDPNGKASPGHEAKYPPSTNKPSDQTPADNPDTGKPSDSDGTNPDSDADTDGDINADAGADTDTDAPAGTDGGGTEDDDPGTNTGGGNTGVTTRSQTPDVIITIK